MPAYRRKPLPVDARQWDGTAENAVAVLYWLKFHGIQAKFVSVEEMMGDPFIAVTSPLDGTLTAGAGTWIIRDQTGLPSLCSDQLFAHLYEEIPA